MIVNDNGDLKAAKPVGPLRVVRAGQLDCQGMQAVLQIRYGAAQGDAGAIQGTRRDAGAAAVGRDQKVGRHRDGGRQCGGTGRVRVAQREDAIGGAEANGGDAFVLADVAGKHIHRVVGGCNA